MDQNEIEDEKAHENKTTRRDFMVYAASGVAAVGAACAAWPLVDALNPSADVLALSSIEVDISQLEPGQTMTVKWRGKPVFITHRTDAEIREERATDLGSLKDPQEDQDRVKPGYEKWLVTIGICTHLGCVPISNKGDYEGWWSQLNRLREVYPLGYDLPTDGSLSPQYVIERLGKISGPESIYAAGVGQHQMWAAQFIGYEHPGTWLNSGGAGTMGYAVPAAMGAKVGRPDTTVWAIDGDGCFQMTNQELATCTINDIPIKVALINNSSLGMVRQWQTLFYNERYSNTDLQSHRFPDFVKLAEAYGAHGLQCDSPDQVDSVIEKALGLNDAPVVIDFVVHRDAMVWPMVAAGTGNDEIMYARSIAPEWGSDD
jgi:ubiquinol-cytochrome c reductase iron-sulfur subunit